MIERFTQLPQSLRERSQFHRLGTPGVPALLTHPDWISPSPIVIWMHGRTAHKELDAGRYLRWLRASGPRGNGIAACAVDLPGHGERYDRELQHPRATIRVLRQMLGEIDQVLEALADPVWQGVFDLDRVAIGGMSAGGMVSLRRLCEPHPFKCCAIEGTTGWVEALYADGGPWSVEHDPTSLEAMDSVRSMGRFQPLPLLALHAQEDRVVPLGLQEQFLEKLRAHYLRAGADPDLIRLVTYPHTGAPQEHAGFGKFGNDAKNEQAAFLAAQLLN